MLRRDEKYLSPQLEIEKAKIVDEANFDATVIEDVFDDFYGHY